MYLVWTKDHRERLTPSKWTFHPAVKVERMRHIHSIIELKPEDEKLSLGALVAKYGDAND